MVGLRNLLILFFLILLGSCSLNYETRESITKGLSPKSLFDEASNLSDQGSYDEAIKTFERLQAAYPASKYALQSKLTIAFLLYKRDRYDESIDKLNDFIKLYPTLDETPYAFYMRGVVAESKSKSILDEYNVTDNAQRDVTSVIDAFNYFLKLIEKYPNSVYTSEAKSKLVTLRNIIARHELFIAIFYTKKNAHIAAINRTKNIIEKFPNTPSVPAALHLIAHNYDLIGAPKLAADARRILEASYPKYIPHYNLDD